MGSTLAEKLIGSHTGTGSARAGEIVSVPVDRLLINDYVGAIVFSKLEALGYRKVAHPDRVFLNIDHNLPSFTVEAADKLVLFREKAEKYGLTHNTRIGSHGIGHQLMCEGFVRPYELAVGTDSHATMYAGLGAFSCGITASDAVSILASGEMWLRVPQSLRIRVSGALRPGVTAKDLALALLGVFPEEAYIYRAVEIVGPTIDEMSVESRLVIANLMAESGAKCAVFEADEKSFAYAHAPAQPRLCSDPDAKFAAEAEFDASALEPMLACPDAVKNVHPLRQSLGLPVDQVFIGSCTNGRLEDLQQAAEILKGRHVAEGTRLLVTPASQSIALEAVRSGLMQTLMEAGAMILTSSCASCAGHGPGLIGRGERCLSTTNRNFKGRMGSTEAEVYLGSAYAAAAAAVTGVITMPEDLLKGGAE